MTDYEHALTVAIKAISELIEDNRKLVAEIETLRESKDCTSSSQRKLKYTVDAESLFNIVRIAMSKTASPAIVASYVRWHIPEFITIITIGGDL